MISFWDRIYTFCKFYAIAWYYILNKKKWPQYNRQRLAYILNYARIHSPYFSAIIGNVNIKEDNAKHVLQTLPQLSKDMIKKEPWHLYSDEIDSNWNLWRNTGGSTGEPLIFPALATPYYIEDICQMMLYLQMGFLPGDVIASFGGNRVSDKEKESNIYWTQQPNFPYGKYSYSTLYLNEKTFQYYIESLNQLSPKYMRGYPSGFISLCKYIEETKTQISFHLHGIYLTSEDFTKEDSDYISSILQCPVYGQYGHSECSVFAVKKPSEACYLCSPLYGYTEVLDDYGNQVEIGEVGEIVVTGFSIAGLPFIRYRTGDLAQYGGETKYGETILKKLLGRTADYIYNYDGDKVYLVGFIFGGHLRAFNYIKTWQIEQNEKGKLYIRIVKGSGYDEYVEEEIIHFFERNKFTIELCYVDEIPKTRRGKRKFLIQNVV